MIRMFERYTERARRALFHARYEAAQFGSASIAAHHLLLGLIREGRGLAVHIIMETAGSTDTIREAIAQRAPRSEKPVPTSVEVPFTDQCQAVLTNASVEADD